MSFLTLAPTSELEAVNKLLSSIGESPVATLADPLNSDALFAISCLSDANRSLQSVGWFFNTRVETWERTNTNEIVVPLSVLSVAMTGDSKGSHAVRQSGKLYDTDNNTFTWNFNLHVEVVYNIPFEDLPQAARNYIVEEAGCLFQEDAVGSEVLYRFEQRRIALARGQLMREQRRTAQPNMMTDSFSTARVKLGRLGAFIRLA